MKPHPYLSFVAVGRNDNYAGDFLHRINAFVLNVITLCERYALPSELILVDWNPPVNRPKLAEAIRWPQLTLRHMALRFIEVPARVHNSLPNSERLPIFEYIAKNVGVRRASGEYVLVTNPDVLFSVQLIRRLAARRLAPGKYYRTARYDVVAPLPETNAQEQLRYCKQHIVRRNGYWYSPAWTLRARSNPYRRLRALAGHVKWQLWNRALINPYVNAAGDFFLMHTRDWYHLCGYPELKSHSHIDSYLTYCAHFSGLRLKILWGKNVYLFHQEHSRTEHQTRPMTDVDEYHRNCQQMVRSRKAIIFNNSDWGLAKEVLAEKHIDNEGREYALAVCRQA